MHPSSRIRRSLRFAALVATAGAGVGLAAPADAQTGPVATLRHGIVVVTGTDAADTLSLTMQEKAVVVDFGVDGTIDARFNRSRFHAIAVSLGAGDDGVGFFSAGDVPISIRTGAGDDGVGLTGHIGQTGEGDAPVSILTQTGNDNVFVATPGQISVSTGAGDDRVEGGGAGIGHEDVSLGSGNDHFLSSMNTFVGTRTDDVDGGTGADTMEVDGTFASERVELSAQGTDLHIRHDFNDTIDSLGVEDVTWAGFGGLDEDGADSVFVDDLTSTGVQNFTPDFSVNGVGDNGLDLLVVSGTNDVDDIVVSGAGTHSTISGLSATVTPVFLEPADTVEIDTLGGDDTVDTSGLQQGLFHLVVV